VNLSFQKDYISNFEICEKVTIALCIYFCRKPTLQSTRGEAVKAVKAGASGGQEPAEYAQMNFRNVAEGSNSPKARQEPAQGASAATATAGSGAGGGDRGEAGNDVRRNSLVEAGGMLSGMFSKLVGQAVTVQRAAKKFSEGAPAQDKNLSIYSSAAEDD
jgi:hypothetical protein